MGDLGDVLFERSDDSLLIKEIKMGGHQTNLEATAVPKGPF